MPENVLQYVDENPVVVEGEVRTLLVVILGSTMQQLATILYKQLERDRASGALAESDYATARDEIQRRLIEDGSSDEAPVTAPAKGRGTLLAIALLLPLSAGVLYAILGNPAALSSPQQHQVTASQIEAMVAKLAAKLEKEDDPKGWVMLARSYTAMGRYEESTRAFGKAEKLVNEDPNLLTDYAEALALSTGGSLRGRPSELIGRALKLDPAFPDALVLAGTAAYEREDFAAAAGYWERLLKQLPPDSEDALSLADSIKKARAATQKQSRKKPAAGKAP